MPANMTANAPANDAPQRPAWLPEKFWDDQTGDVRLEMLARSYGELERMMSANPARDLPQSPFDYQIDADDLLEIDDDVNQRLFEEGFSNRQAQLVYDLAAERLLPMVEQVAEQYEDARQLDTLFQHFGSPERFEAIRPQLRAWGAANMPPHVFEALASSAEGVIAIHDMMTVREPGLARSGSAPMGASETDLKSMMSDPRYWKDKDPAFIARVREGFRALYPDA